MARSLLNPFSKVDIRLPPVIDSYGTKTEQGCFFSLLFSLY